MGDDDEIGTLNLIDGDAVRRGRSRVSRTGKRFSLAVRLDQHSPQIGSIPGRINPLHAMVAVNTEYQGTPDGFCTSDDIVTMGLQAATHWDALSHVSYGGKLYNGFPASSITPEAGATRCGIAQDRPRSCHVASSSMSPARSGRERLEGGYGITPDDLDAALALADAVDDRAGRRRARPHRATCSSTRLVTARTTPADSNRDSRWRPRSGSETRDVAAVATDTVAFEVYPGERDDVLFPVHLLHLRDMGMTQGQNFDLEALSVDCAGDGVYQFLLEASPLPFTGAVGSPVNPVAIK